MKVIVGIILFSIVFPINEEGNISFQYGMLGRLESKNNQIMIRKKLGEQVRNQLRIVPDLQFFLDDSAAYADEIDRLLKK